MLQLNIKAFWATLLIVIALPAFEDNANDRLKEANIVVNELLAADDKGVPKDLLASAHCAIIPARRKADSS